MGHKGVIEQSVRATAAVGSALRVRYAVRPVLRLSLRGQEACRAPAVAAPLPTACAHGSGRIHYGQASCGSTSYGLLTTEASLSP